MRPHIHTQKPLGHAISSGSQSSSVGIDRHSPVVTSPLQCDPPSGIHKTGRRTLYYQKGSSVVRECHIPRHIIIEALPDNVLLDIFEVFLWNFEYLPWDQVRGWYNLVHVCRRWRDVIFSSPFRLDLHLFCTDSTPVRKMLDIWPPLPIEISSISPNLGDNVLAALEHPDRIRNIFLSGIRPLDRLVTVMQEPFPILGRLKLSLSSFDEAAPVLPNTFLGGSAPLLQVLAIDHISYPTLPKLLSSCSDLVDLILERIPHSGYISPEAMSTCVSTLTRLTVLHIGFESPDSRPNVGIRHPPPLTRATLPTLTQFQFHGVSEYLEDLVARIDAPQLHDVDILLFNQLVMNIRQLPQFFSHAPILMSYNQAEMTFDNGRVVIRLDPPGATPGDRALMVGVSCGGADWQVSSMAQICNQLSFFLSRIQRLDIQEGSYLLKPTWQIDMDDTQWLELFHPFTAVHTLHISRKLRPLIVLALRRLGGELPVATGVLPALDDLYLEKYPPSRSEQLDIEPFITARQSSDHPVTLHRWEKEESLPLGLRRRVALPTTVPVTWPFQQV